VVVDFSLLNNKASVILNSSQIFCIQVHIDTDDATSQAVPAAAAATNAMRAALNTRLSASVVDV
jgi:hypothetical protein